MLNVITPNPLLGVGLHSVGALFAATCYTPQKKVKGWAWQTYWLTQVSFCWFLLPVIGAWLNDVVYEMASFMVLRESTPWRWSHTRHHTDTIIVGCDPEIAAPRPPDMVGILLAFFSLKGGPKEYKKILLHCAGKLTAEEKLTFLKSNTPKCFGLRGVGL